MDRKYTLDHCFHLINILTALSSAAGRAKLQFTAYIYLHPLKLQIDFQFAMRSVIQRVSEASVKVDGETTGQVGHGLLVLLGIEDADSDDDIEWLASKIVN